MLDLPQRGGFGPLQPDPRGLLDLPEGFSYRIVSRTGDRMDDGLLVPGQPDGMAAFPAPPPHTGRVIIVRNHELVAEPRRKGAFGEGLELLGKIPADRFYDRGHGVQPMLGGTTTLLYDPGTHTLERSWLSLAGTAFNCAGGPTPWGTWLSCEEDTTPVGMGFEKSHGYVFEVPAVGGLEAGLTRPKPLTALGRFRHEAVAVDPATGIGYQTEDLPDGVIYRFIPDQPGRLVAGGRLQALCIAGRHALDTRNWDAPAAVAVGERLDVSWIDLDEVQSPRDDLRKRAAVRGAAVFARAEGMWFGRSAVYFVCTNGGRHKRGQVWRYSPPAPRPVGAPASERPSSQRDAEPGGRLELFLEPNDLTAMENGDNITTAPWGDLVICEDGFGEQFLIGVTPAGESYKLARNAATDSEFAGATFAPDGATLLVNLQRTGLTLAVFRTAGGPWRRG